MTGSRWLFGSAVFLGAFLLFLVEPIAAKQLLPVLGGSAAVWVTCLVFFQTALLCAYLYAHWMSRRPRWNLYFALLILGFASAVGWCWRIGGAEGASTHPILTVFGVLGGTIGLPFLVLGTTSPLMQVWWARLHESVIPYRLFALSNLASLLALGLYPTVIEPRLTLEAQRIAWCCGFAVFASITGLLAWQTRKVEKTSLAEIAVDDEGTTAPPMHRLLWVLLPMGAAMQLSAVTSYLTANVAAIPLLWILPLAVYLLTIILAFEFPRLLPRSLVARFLILMLAGLGYALSKQDVEWPLRISIGFFLIEAFAAGLFCHSEAYRLRPQRAAESTLFYLSFAAGGALGAFVIGILFPMVFRFNLDLVITCCFTALLALLVMWGDGWSVRLLWGVATILMAVQIFWINIVNQRNTTVAVRNFYGALRVKQNFGFPGATMRVLTNGNVEHGTQIFGTNAQRRTPTSYYAEDSGVGLAIRNCCSGGARNIGVVGLGAGTIAAYGRPGDRIQFYEINPSVEPIARNVFTYIRDSGARVSIIDGDARRSLAAEAPQGFNVVVVDAFSGDAIPLHLLTTQALALYRRHLAPGGIIAFHISNRHVDLEAPIALLAKAAGMRAMAITTAANDDRGEFTATWMLVSDNADFFAQPEVEKGSRQPREIAGLRPWTDDFSSLLPVLHW
ncbi:fused MFS/spermidine synthase [Telmatobacter sp. DSM 110680]|uniref:Fused MFS/spermidine synthase n=1 Tax=Telmatobacter sp. DSM 110680 TaxID=3036704 RepID=A0AAU7DJI0_9BACT